MYLLSSSWGGTRESKRFVQWNKGEGKGGGQIEPMPGENCSEQMARSQASKTEPREAVAVSRKPSEFVL